MTRIAIVVLGMTAVTYIPRLLPLVLRARGEPPEWMKRTLQLLPFTAIGALIIPDAFTSVPGGAAVAVGGLAVAAVITWLTRQPFLAVIGAILAAAGLQALV